MKVTLKQFFSIGDGRLSTEIGDVYKMLSYIFDTDIYTNQIPTAMRKLKEVNPDWFSLGVDLIEELKKFKETNDFNELMKAIGLDYEDFEIELGKIEFDIPLTAGLVHSKTK